MRWGDDEPFTDVAVKAGRNAAHPVLPARFQVYLTATDLIGERDMNSWDFTLSEVPAYPAGSDPWSVRHLLTGETDPVGPEQIRERSDCATGVGPVPAVTSSAVPGQQPAASIKPGAAERVEKALLGPNAVAGMAAGAFDPPYVEDVASHVCGNGPQLGAVSTVFGQERVWRGGDRGVRQFAGAYGMITAAEAVAQVNGVLGCGEYTEYMIKYAGVHQVDLPKLPGIDQQRMFCETVAKKSSRCTVLLARGDVLTRILARAANQQDAADLARMLAVPAAAALR
ncbi:hypothetical protein [Actinoplanes sp. NPDC049802]|uniref:hypothetical protein n=1 Tax=Actinoplanes sp. NPDC049802 TaxID=3154742 RepID=UPI0033CCED0E